MSTHERLDLCIPKIPVAVELSLDGGAVRHVEIFVAEHLDDGYRRQHVADLLATAEQFHPARDRADNSWALFNKAITVWIRIPLTGGSLPVEEVEPGAAEELFNNQSRVSVEMKTGEVLSGDLLYSLPPDRSRAVDYLNSSERFFRLWTPEYLYLVNTAYVIRLVELARNQPSSTEHEKES